MSTAPYVLESVTRHDRRGRQRTESVVWTLEESDAGRTIVPAAPLPESIDSIDCRPLETLEGLAFPNMSAGVLAVWLESASAAERLRAAAAHVPHTGGNTKLGAAFFTVNLGDSHSCPSRARGLCRVETAHDRGALSHGCYSLTLERARPGTRRFHERQGVLFHTLEPGEVCTAVAGLVAESRRRGRPLEYGRLHQDSDFYSQSDIEWAEDFSRELESREGLTVAGYTARSDLDFSGVRSLVLNGSGWMGEGLAQSFTAVESFSRGALRCIGDCERCNGAGRPGFCYFRHGRPIEVLSHR